jgi:hypothetical protein
MRLWVGETPALSRMGGHTYIEREAHQNHHNGLMHVPACMYNKLWCSGEGRTL